MVRQRHHDSMDVSPSKLSEAAKGAGGGRTAGQAAAESQT